MFCCRPVWGRCWYDCLLSSLLICSTSTCPEPRLVVQVFAQALLPCQLLLAFGKRNANCTTRRCTSMCAASQCTCLAVPAALSRKAQSAYASKWGQDYCNMIFLNMYHLNCTLHSVHFIALSHEAKSEWYRTQLAKFCGGRGICTDVTSGAEKFTLGSRIRLRGTGYSWPGLFSGSLQVHSRFNMFTWFYMDDDIIIYIIKISF